MTESCTTYKSPALRILIGIILTAGLSLGFAAEAATFTVNSTADAVDASPGDSVCATAGAVCTLRAAIQESNALAGADTVTVPAGIYTLTLAGTAEDAAATGDLDITEDIVINGNAVNATIIDANAIDRVFEILGATVTASNLTIRNGNGTGDGGGIAADATASLTLFGSTISGNTATSDGGGIAAIGGTVVLTNVTISGNTATRGGGLFCVGPCTLTNVTVTQNTAPPNGDGVRQQGSGSITFLNTIVANNGMEDCKGNPGSLFSNGNNLSSDATCDFTSAGDLENNDPLLGPLQDNGGPTYTHALLVGSPAIDAGTNIGCPATDQRGVARPFNVTCDIGAYEQGLMLPALAVIKFATTLEDPFSGTTDPKAIPRAIVQYTIRVINFGTGPADADSVTTTDPIPASLSLRVTDYDGANPGPVAFVDGSPSSGLGYTFTSLGSTTDDVEFSNDGGGTWTYTPVDSGDGTDSAVTDVRITPKGIFTSNTGSGNPSFQLRFKAVIQ